MVEAWLLLGPTGSGKTPLGDALAAASGGRRRHFDFGACLRAVDAGRLSVPGLGEEGRAIVRDVLARGALLAEDQWFVARAILAAFLAGPPGPVVLNGLPRHVAQADAIAALVDVRRVIVLECDAATVRGRLARDTGGDRAGRVDDGPAAVERRLARYHERTRPLVAYYRARGVPVDALAVKVDTTAADLLLRLQLDWAAGGPRMAIQGHDHTYVETSDYPAARRFWEALGFIPDSEWGGEGHRACRLAAGDTFVVLAECAPGGRPQGPTAHFRTAAPEELEARLRVSGDVEVVTPLEPTHWNTRWIRVRDPDGNLWVLEAPPS